jgi:hypothetical protein
MGVGRTEEQLKILNLTQTPATPEQIASGLVDPVPEVSVEIARLG